jgi:inner membrane transporter RhtA
VPAPLLALAAIVSVQIGSAFARTLFDTAGAGGSTLLRLGISGALLLAMVRPRPARWSPAARRAAVLLGATMAVMNLSFYQAIERVPLGIAVTVEFLGPLLVALAQTRRLRDLGWALLALAGVALLGLGDRTSAPLTGAGFALLAGLFWGIYILASARVGRLLPGTGGLAVALATAALLTVPFGAAGVGRSLHRPDVLLGGLLVALLASLIPYALELSALRRMPTRVFGVLMSTEPAVGALAGLAVLGQTLHSREIAALVMVSAASAGVTVGAEGVPPPGE